MIVCRLRLNADESVSRPVADFVAALAQRGGLTSKQAYRLRLAVDEVATNVTVHGYGDGGCGVVDLEGGVDADTVWVRVEDDAPAFDPRTHDPGPRLAAGLAHPDGREGGLGLFLALSNVDEFAYDRVGGRNRNTMIIRRTAASGVGSGELEGGTDARQAGTGRR